MESMGIPNSPSGLELTIATPCSGNGVYISSSSVSDGNKCSNVENTRELALLDAFNLQMSRGGEDVDAHTINNMDTTGEKDGQPINQSSFKRCKYNRLSQEQSDLLQGSFQQNQYPDKGMKQALADTLKLTLKQVQIWFLNRRARMKKHNMVQNGKEHKTYKRQVESLTNETHHLRHKINKLKKKIKNLKLKQALSMASPPRALPPPPEQQQQKQVMYVPVLTGLLPDCEKNVATTAAAIPSFITQQGSVSATTSFPIITNTLLMPSSGGSKK